jgi:Polyketide cyclase / dehydrase and lipid transport
VTRRVQLTPEQIFAVIADGWSFASWVVGAAHIRAVDSTWPAVGSRIHHSVGPWPLSIDDTTTVRAVEPGTMIELAARLWPVGSARVRIALRPVSPTETEIVFEEEADGGPARLLPEAAQAVVLRPRNTESLRRLADIAAGRGGTPGAG